MDAAGPTLPKTVKMSGKDTSKHPLPEETRGSVPSRLRCLESLYSRMAPAEELEETSDLMTPLQKKCHNMLEAKFVDSR